jgi:hypothetical protein
MTHFDKHATRVSLIVLTLLVLISGCRKSDNIFTVQPNDYRELKKQFFNASTADPEVQKVAADIKKQDSIFKFLPDFVKKNGIPKWDKVLYKVSGMGNATLQSGNRSAARISTEDNSQGMFFIPLQSQSTGKIQSYIAAFKHGDSTYTYKLFNKDSLERDNPGNTAARNATINSLGVLAYFEKTINNQPTSQYKLSQSETVEFKNPAITISEPTPSNRSGRSSNSARTTSDCFYSLTVTETYTEINVYVNGELVYHYESYTVEVVAVIWGDCSGGGGTSGGSSGWYNWGTGYNGDPYWDPYNYGWLYPWWTSGGTGGYDPYAALSYQLNSILAPGDSYEFNNNLDPSQSLAFASVGDFQNWLASNAANQQADLSTPETIIDPNTKIEHAKFNLTFVGGIDISCKVEKVNNLWNLLEVTSTEYGVTLGWSWEQTGYSQSTSGNEITVIVEGYAKYNVIIESFGTVYKQKYKFQIKIDKTTGKITSLSKL